MVLRFADQDICLSAFASHTEPAVLSDQASKKRDRLFLMLGASVHALHGKTFFILSKNSPLRDLRGKLFLTSLFDIGYSIFDIRISLTSDF